MKLIEQFKKNILKQNPIQELVGGAEGWIVMNKIDMFVTNIF